jgi:dsRNA-specific ribonuclease
MDITPEFIKRVFNKSKIDPKYMGVLTNPEALAIYRVAFTSNTVDSDNNYELYEYMGDVAANAAVVMYFYEVFPQLRCPRSINILNRLKIVHVSRESFSKIAEDLGFWPHIRYNASVAAEKPILKKSREALLEDVFEAFVGATEIILIDAFGMVGVASQIIYNFIKPIFDAKDISFAPEDLYDAKTRLKELFEIRKNVPNPLADRYGAPRYMDALPPANTVTLRFTKNQRLLFHGTGTSKQQSHKIAAQAAIDYFEKEGYRIEKRFNLFCV